MLEYAISRLMFVCPIAAKLPSSMLAIDRISIIGCHCTVTCPNGPIISRNKTTNGATFGAVLMNAVTGVGAPS